MYSQVLTWGEGVVCVANAARYLIDDIAQGISIQRMGDPFDTRWGDTRHYDYTSYCLDSSKFPRGRFVSEFGWQSYPSMGTLEKVNLPSLALTARANVSPENQLFVGQ